MKAAHFVVSSLLAGLVLIAASVTWLALVAEERSYSSAPGSNFYDWESRPQQDSGQPQADAQQVNDAPIVRVRVPRLGIDAAVEVLGLNADGAMQDPRSPTTVAWYDFTGQPGAIGNVVLAGHVDYYNYGPAVFWRLRDLKPGDGIELALQDGSVFRYEVSSLTYYDAAAAPVGEIVGQTPYEAITLITCGGSFNRRSLEYDQRLIVRALRV